MRSRANDYEISVFLVVALLPPLLAAAVFWVLPIGDLGADRTAMAARDYSDMWAAGRLVALGKVNTLFDIEIFNAELRSMFGAGFTHQVWPYPPPTLLLAVPLSALPLFTGFLLYTAATIGSLWLALRSSGLTVAASAIVLLSPAVAHNALVGQNGSLIAAILFGGLSLVPRRAIMGGAILGALIIKPQFGLLLPLCLAASGNWRAMFAMATSSGVLILASVLSFGVEPWIGFFVHTQSMIAAILKAPWEALPAQQIFASTFMAARSLGASLELAWGLQIAVAILCAIVAWSIWQRQNDVDPLVRAALTGLLAVAAAPWAHSYDMVLLSVAVVVLIRTAHRTLWFLLGFAWLWPGAVDVMSVPLALSVTSVVSVAWLGWHELGRVDPSRNQVRMVGLLSQGRQFES